MSGYMTIVLMMTNEKYDRDCNDGDGWGLC